MVSNTQLHKDIQKEKTKVETDSGLQCLLIIANFHGIAADAQQIKHAFAIHENETSFMDIQKISKQLGLRCRIASLKLPRLSKLRLPAILSTKENGFIVLAQASEDGKKFLIFDPLQSKPTPVTDQELMNVWTGKVILFAPKEQTDPQKTEFGIKWFIPALWKYKKLIIEILIASFLLNLFGLIAPLFTQVIIDKVLVHQGIATLNVLVIGLILIMLFEFVINLARNYVFTHTTSRIDITLGVKLFNHLFRLPLAYFENRRTGDTIARIRELENIRQFLTGTPLTAVLDLFFMVVYIVVMLYYSTSLTMVVVASIPLFILLSLIFIPLIKHRLEEKFQKGSDSQSYLVEAVSGIQTLKSFALEPLAQKKWENLQSSYIKSNFKLAILSGTAGSIGQLIQKMSTLAILWYGTHLVLQGSMSVGQLIAFQMLAGRVSDPVMRLVQMWQDFQQTGVSISKLKDIFSIQPEPSMSTTKATLPRINGQIKFEKVTFRYQANGPEILRNLSLDMDAGNIIGVVGRSGSGKSTLSKLIQRLYVPESGRILIDGVDLSMADPSWLRRQVGVVLQENYLFSGTIRENIAIHHPAATIEQIVNVAKLAGAHEFISELMEGYDAVVGERGTSLSGGQKQRVAIARALLSNPRILIFDEATSALDYESERIIQSNLKHICKGRTVIIIAHRLSTIMSANKIVVLDKGELVESGSHQQLMQAQGLYRYLYSQQERD